MENYFKVLNSALIITINVGLWALIWFWFDPEALNNSWNNGDKASFYSVYIVTTAYALIVMLACAFVHVKLSDKIDKIFKIYREAHNGK